MRRYVHVSLIIVILATFPLISSLLFSIHPVSANPGGFDSHPTAHVATGGLAPAGWAPVIGPSKAYDEDNGTSAEITYGVQTDGGSFNLTTFEGSIIDYPIIGNPEFKMRYSTNPDTSNPDEQYRIQYYVSPSPTLTVLLGWTDAAAVPEDTYVWSGSAEPNDGTWNWTDVENIRFVVEVTDVIGGADDSKFNLFEAWVTVPVGPPPPSVVSVDPASIIDFGKTPGSTFFVDVNVSNVIDLWGYEITLSYDTSILTAISYSSYAPFNIPWPSGINDTQGIVEIAYSMPLGVWEGFTGHTNLARVTFSVDALGKSTLNVHDSKLTDVYGDLFIHSENDGYFRNTYLGDIDGNGNVGSSDFSILAGEYGLS